MGGVRERERQTYRDTHIVRRRDTHIQRGRGREREREREREKGARQKGTCKNVSCAIEAVWA